MLEAEISESREAGIRYNFNGLFSTTDQLRLQIIDFICFFAIRRIVQPAVWLLERLEHCVLF
ncbi:MAG: hypothetical protein OXD01_02955 [Gammaproteobacteria bacterium]|nr:hypothetical protein [Gammaproteobacteria bacterium]